MGLEQLVLDCFAGKQYCPLYDNSLGMKVTKFMIHLRENPIPVVHNGTIDLITVSDVRYQLFRYLHSPMEYYPWIGQMLADLLAGNTTFLLPELPRIKFSKPPTRLILQRDPVPPPIIPPLPDYAHNKECSSTILCGDGEPLRGMSKDDFHAYLVLLLQQEPLAAGYWASIKLPCVFWPDSIRPAERNRFTGPFASAISSYAKGASPILWIGNTADPVTPIRNAYAMAEKHEGSVVLTQDMPGHCSGEAKPSRCTHGVIKRFFANGTLPERNMVCSGKRRPWDGKGAIGEQKARRGEPSEKLA